MKVKPSTLKRKIFQWNLRMVLVTLCVFLVMNGCLFAALRHFYAGTSGLTGELPASLEQAKVLMDEPLSDTKDAAFADLAARLAPLDFHLCVRQNGAFLYRDADYMTGELTETLDQFTNADGQSHVYAQFGLTVVSRHDAAQNLDLYAFHGTTLEYALQRNGFAMLLLLLLLDGGLCITGMVIVSNLFTRRLSKRITVPLDALHNAAARVTNGDMTQPISYQGEAEFEQVCTAFNGMQTEILEANARRDAYERARIDMVAGVSHDLRTPLTAIQGAIKGVQDGIAATPEAQAEFLAIAYRRSQDMNKMLERLLYVSRLETGVIPLHLERTEWRGFLADYAAQAAPTRGKLTLDASSDDATLCSLIDPDQMRRILDNLIENSVKYAQADDLTLRLRLCAKGDQVQVDFSDNGVGVSSEQLPRIFEQFYRADESRTREKGNGLGLFIVSRLVEAMGGSVRAENSNGLWIRMTFPKAEGDEADAE